MNVVMRIRVEFPLLLMILFVILGVVWVRDAKNDFTCAELLNIRQNTHHSIQIIFHRCHVETDK